MKNIIRRWLVKFLGIDVWAEARQREIQVLQKQLDWQKGLHEIQNKINQDLTPVLDEITDRLKKQEALMVHTRSLIHVGVDVSLPNKYDRSWAVICVKGKNGDAELVKFIELEFEYMQQLYKILKDFEGCNVRQDMPHGIPKYLFPRNKGF